MNYAVMYEFCVDKNSGQYKGPFNQIFNEHRVFTYKDTAIVTPNSDTPYSMLWVDLRAEPMCYQCQRYQRTATIRRSSSTAIRTTMGMSAVAPPGPQPGNYLIVGPDWKGETPARNKSGFPFRTTFSVLRLFAHNSSTRKTCRTSRKCRQATKRRHSPPICTNLRRQPPPPSTFRKLTPSW